MTAPELHHTMYRGSVVAAGIVIETSLVPEALVRRRLMALAWAHHEAAPSVPGAGLRVLEGDGFVVALFSREVRLDCATVGGAPLVRHGTLWTTAPLAQPHEPSAQAGPERMLRLHGGRTHATSLDELAPRELSTWLEVSSFTVLEVEPLGTPVTKPTQRQLPPALELRGRLDLRPSSESRAAAQALQLALRTPQRELRPASGLAAGWASLRALATALWHLGAGLRRRIKARVWLSRPGAVGNARPGAAEAQALPADQLAAPRGLWQRVRRQARALAARAILQTRLARLIGRRHAQYLSRLLEMFEDNRLDEALRHAIPLGDDTHTPQLPPSLGLPGPRESLAVDLAPRMASHSRVPLHEDLFEILRQRYRAAFERLRAHGEIEKAAFVLAELLHANEEAVQFLEHHGRLRLAAELAEARGLPPGLVIRQWVLAKDLARAVSLAQRTGAFAEAVLQLQRTHPVAADALRLAWAESLAKRGAYAGAVEVAWQLPNSRDHVKRWLGHAIAVGGPVGARMLIRQVWLFPETFAEVCQHQRELLRSPDTSRLTRHALAEELLQLPPRPELAILARPLLRRLLQDAEGQDRDGLLHRLVDATGDAVLRADLRAAWGAQPHPRGAVVVSARAIGQHGDCAMATLLDDGAAASAKRQRMAILESESAQRGVLLGVVAFALGHMPADTASVGARALESSVRRLRPSHHGDMGTATAALVTAMQQLGSQWYHERHGAQLRDPRAAKATLATVCGTTLVLAHVGTTRGYLLREGRLTQLTRDDTLLEQLRAARLAEGNPMTAQEMADFPHQGIITSLIGTSSTVAVSVTELALQRGDILMLCSEPVWTALTDEELAQLMHTDPTPKRSAEHLLRAALARGKPQVAIAVARFEGEVLPVPLPENTTRPPQLRRYTAPAHDAPHSLALQPLSSRSTPLSLCWPKAQRGSVPVLDAALLPDGKLLLALGEAGACVVTREGRVTARFGEPAHQLVLSDHGDRAIAIAPRGHARRLAKVDLLARRARPWCDVPFDAHAATYDGRTWFVGHGDTVFAIEADASGWEHSWKVDHPGNDVRALARSSSSLTAWFRGELWTYELPSLTLRTRAPQRDFAVLSGAPSPAGVFLGWTPRKEQDPALQRKDGLRAHLVDLQCELGLRPPGRPDDAFDPIFQSLDELVARLPPPVLSDNWCAVPICHPGSTSISLYTMAHSDPSLLLSLEGPGCAVGVRFCEDQLLCFDTWGRVLALSLSTGELTCQLCL